MKRSANQAERTCSAKVGAGMARNSSCQRRSCGLMQMQPVKGAMHRQLRGQARDAVLCERGRIAHEGYSTETRKRPRAGAVWPAAARSRAARMRGIASGGVAAGGDVDEGSDEVADHVMQKAGAGDPVDDEAGFLLPAGVMDGAGGGLCRGGDGWWAVPHLRGEMRGTRFVAGGEVGVDGGEAGEVVGAEDVVGGPLSEGQIDGPGAIPDVWGLERGADVVGGAGCGVMG